jgi:hypothetical protein
MSNKITLTPGQAVTIHGWVRARLSLTWGDVLANEEINLHVLLGYNITEASLHQLQPDLQAWIRSKKVRLEDMPRMTLWEPHPIKDLKADLADLARMRWPMDTLAAMHVTYQDLTEIGLNPVNMHMLGITFAGWATLGFSRCHAEPIPPHILYNLFGMTKESILNSLR